MKTQGKSWFKFRNAAGRAEISIMDEIGAYGVTGAMFKDALDTVPPSQPILLKLHSTGGSITEGNQIYNDLAAHPGGVEVECGAIAASIASVIAMAGNPVTMPPNGFLMIHNPLVATIGDANEHRQNAGIMDKMKAGIVAAYAKKTGKPSAELSQMMDAETWMTADEALSHGFIDSIRSDSVKDYVNFDLSMFRNSANFAARLQKQSDPAKELAGQTGGGNSSANVTLSDLEHAIEGKAISAQPASNPVHQNTLPDRTVPKMDQPTVEDFKKSPEFQNVIASEAKRLLDAQNKRHGEIDEIVTAVAKRDKKDFSDLAGKFKQDGKSPDEFARAIATSEQYKTIENKVVGSGIEIVDEFRGQNVAKGSPGELFVASAEYRAARDSYSKGSSRFPNTVVKTAHFADLLARCGFLNASGTSESGLTSIQKQPEIIQLTLRRLTVKDLLAPGATTSTTIRYIQESTFTNAATTVAEAGTKPAATFALAEVDAVVKKIAAYTKVSDEMLADYVAVASLINTRLPYMVERTEEDQLLNGDGTGSNLTGLLQTSGIQTQAKAADTAADAIFKALTKVRYGSGLSEGGYEPDGIVFNPLDWQNLRLSKDANNQYFGGGPFTGAYGNGSPVQFDMFWGKPVVVTPAIAAGTALIGAFRMAAQYFQRMGLVIETTNSNEDDFIKNLTAIRAEERLALCVYRPSAFTQVTGL